MANRRLPHILPRKHVFLVVNLSIIIALVVDLYLLLSIELRGGDRSIAIVCALILVSLTSIKWIMGHLAKNQSAMSEG